MNLYSLLTYQHFRFRENFYTSYTQETQTVCKKINIFYLNNSIVEALLLGDSATRKSYAIITNRIIPYGK